ncbi:MULTISPECIES: hypothetical protein [unclassified Acinetobacter]|uniref:hypothetical protein n=1 Tax=unclassified Acinetobacter TaxID=196816 RepID=UPI0035BA142C
MGGQRVPKSKIFLKAEEKIIRTLLILDKKCSDEEILDKFKELFPDDWMKIVKRYEAHERITPIGESHPMPPPRNYLLNKFRKYRQMYNNGENLGKILEELNKPKSKFTEETPENIEILISHINTNLNYKDGILAINKLAKFKCAKSIDALMRFMESDANFELRKLAFDRLVRFGCDVKHPSKSASKKL